MPSRELGEKYGAGNSRALVNRAIRAELVGGDKCLDALTCLDQLKIKWTDRGWTEGLADIDTALSATRRLRDRMVAEIRRRYGMPPERD